MSLPWQCSPYYGTPSPAQKRVYKRHARRWMRQQWRLLGEDAPRKTPYRG